MPARLSWIVVSLLVLSGCGDDPVVAVDAGPAPDATPADDSGAPDGGTVTPEVTLTYAGRTEPLDRARFGYERTAGAITGLYFELSRGGGAECPSETSPAPDQLVVLGGFEGGAPATRTEADGVRVSFFDFEGRFRDEVAPASATAARLEVVAIDATAGTAEATVTATFDQGSVEGTFVATHCESFDVDG